MTTKNEMACGDCFFWKVYTGKDRQTAGECHRYPPKHSDWNYGNVDCEWLETASHDWCGEFKSKGSGQ